MTTKYRTSRRSFLKNSATLGSALVIPGFSARVFAETVKDGQTIITAAHWGPLAVTVKDGKIQSSVPAIEDLGDNPLQTVVADQVHNKVRVERPMIRKGFLENLDNITQPDGKRGDDTFIPISWERAYDIIEQQLRRIYASYGPQSIFAGSYGWRSSGSLHKAFTLMQRFLRPASAGSGTDWLASGASKLAIPVARIADALHNPGGEYAYNGQTRHYPHIRLIWWCGGNPYHHQDLNRLRAGWQKPEIVIVNEPYWTATAKHADIVLPATTSYERNDLTMTGDYSNMHIVPMKKIVEPQGEAKNDYDIFLDLAKRFGVEAAYSEGKSEMQWLKSFYDEAQQSARQQRIAMPLFQQFWEENKIYENPRDPKADRYVRYADYRADPILNPLGTPSGKIELYSKTIEAMHYDDCLPHASWLPPVEYLGNAPAEYPLQLVTPHNHYRLHSQLNQTSLRKHYAVANREPLWIHPEDAAARGIKTGDLVRVYNARGQVLAGAVVSASKKTPSPCTKARGTTPPTAARTRSVKTAAATCSPSTVAPRASPRATPATPRW